MKYLMYFGVGMGTFEIGETVSMEAKNIKIIDNKMQPEYPSYIADELMHTSKTYEKEVSLERIEEMSKIRIDEGEAIFTVHIRDIPPDEYRNRKYGTRSFSDMIAGLPVHIDCRMFFGEDFEHYEFGSSNIWGCISTLQCGGKVHIESIDTRILKYPSAKIPDKINNADAILVYEVVKHSLSRWKEVDEKYEYLGYLSANKVKREINGEKIRYIIEKNDFLNDVVIERIQDVSGWKFIIERI